MMIVKQEPQDTYDRALNDNRGALSNDPQRLIDDFLKRLPTEIALINREMERLRTENAQQKIELDNMSAALTVRNGEIEELQAEVRQLRGGKGQWISGQNDTGRVEDEERGYYTRESMLRRRFAEPQHELAYAFVTIFDRDAMDEIARLPNVGESASSGVSSHSDEFYVPRFVTFQEKWSKGDGRGDPNNAPCFGTLKADQTVPVESSQQPQQGNGREISKENRGFNANKELSPPKQEEEPVQRTFVPFQELWKKGYGRGDPNEAPCFGTLKAAQNTALPPQGSGLGQLQQERGFGPADRGFGCVKEEEDETQTHNYQITNHAFTDEEIRGAGCFFN